MKLTNCPNCGAVITSPKCEYCGTIFEDEEVSVIVAKIEILNQQKIVERLYRSAIEAMKNYGGNL